MFFLRKNVNFRNEKVVFFPVKSHQTHIVRYYVMIIWFNSKPNAQLFHVCFLNDFVPAMTTGIIFFILLKKKPTEEWVRECSDVSLELFLYLFFFFIHLSFSSFSGSEGNLGFQLLIYRLKRKEIHFRSHTQTGSKDDSVPFQYFFSKKFPRILMRVGSHCVYGAITFEKNSFWLSSCVYN